MAGRITVVQGDITRHKEAESRLRAQEKLFRITLDSIGDAVMSTDREGCLATIRGFPCLHRCKRPTSPRRSRAAVGPHAPGRF